MAMYNGLSYLTKEGLVFYVIVSEEESDSSSSLTSDTIQGLQILQQVTAAVRPAACTHINVIF